MTGWFQRNILHVVRLGVSAALLLTSVGCGTGAVYIDLSSPRPAMNPTSAGKTIVIRSVTDDRLAFSGNQEPDSALRDVPEEMREKTIVRLWRGGSSHNNYYASGNKTVAEGVSEALRVALEGRGLRVITGDPGSVENTKLLDVSIRRFWVLTNAFGHHVDAVLDTLVVVTVDGRTEKMEIQAKGVNPCYKSDAGSVSTENLRVAVERVLMDFIEKAQSRLAP